MARAHFLGSVVDAPDQCFTLINDSSGKVIAPSIEAAFDSRTRRRGLLGRDGLAPETAFIIAPTSAIHTFGMRFPIDLLFVAPSGTVVKRVIALKRARIAAALQGFAAIEFCANHPGVAATKVGDRLRLASPGREKSTRDRK